MLDVQRLIAHLKAKGLIPGGENDNYGVKKPIDKKAQRGVPIEPCCLKMGHTIMYPHECNCPGHPHRGIIISSTECGCGDWMIHCEELPDAPPDDVSFTNGTKPEPASVEVIETTVIPLSEIMGSGAVHGDRNPAEPPSLN